MSYKFSHWLFNSELRSENPLEVDIAGDSELVAVYSPTPTHNL